MGIRARLGSISAALAAASLLAPGAALAAPPPNDARADAQPVPSLPATVDGTTVESTLEGEAEPESRCAAIGGSVWFRVAPGAKGRVILDLAANGDLDAAVDVYSVRRSQLTGVACGLTNKKGKLQFDFKTAKDQVFLIRVARRENAAEDTFSMMLRLAEPDARPPGTPLPRQGATGTLHRILNPSDAYSVELSAGVTYRFNLASKRCTALSIYRPGTRSFRRRPLRALGCEGYTEFTPGAGQGGTYTLLASATNRRGKEPYRLTVARAGDDDTAPGRFIRNYARVSGRLNANGVDVIDLYRFDVEKRSNLDITLESKKPLRLAVYKARGSRIASGPGEIHREVKPGRYFALVRAPRSVAGSYTLRRISRTITATSTTWDGHGATKADPDESVELGGHVRPRVAGPVAVRVQRFDPVYGWQFFRAYRRRTDTGGDVTIPFDPPSVGRWRARTIFLGTRGASPSESTWAYLTAQDPLDQ